MQTLLERITVNEGVCNGKPVIVGKRITVQSIPEYLGAGDAAEDILKQFPSPEPEDVQASLLLLPD